MSNANNTGSDKAHSHLFSTTKGPDLLPDIMFTVGHFWQCSLKLWVPFTLRCTLNPINTPYLQIKGKQYRCSCAKDYAT